MEGGPAFQTATANKIHRHAKRVHLGIEQRVGPWPTQTVDVATERDGNWNTFGAQFIENAERRTDGCSIGQWRGLQRQTRHFDVAT